MPVSRRTGSEWFRSWGQQLQLEILMKGGELSWSEPVWLGCLTVAASLLILFLAAEQAGP